MFSGVWENWNVQFDVDILTDSQIVFHVVWVLLFWNLLVTSRFLMVGRAGSSSDRAAFHLSLPAVRSTSSSAFIINFIFCFGGFLICLFVFAGLSQELQSVLQMMLNPEPSERPTVSELLSLPSVWKYRWRRRVYLMFTEAALTLVSIWKVHSCKGPKSVSSLAKCDSFPSLVGGGVFWL